MTFKSTTNAIISSAMLALPMSGCYHRNTMPEPVAPKANIKINTTSEADIFTPSPKTESPLVKDLPRDFYNNKKGARVEEFGEEKALWTLAERLYDTTGIPPKYIPPINTDHKPFIAAEGIFGAPKGIIPNLGVDISIPNDSTNKPIAVLAPTKGIIIKQQKPIHTRGMQETKIMSTDGLIYSFKFITKAKDYLSAKLPYIQKIGTDIKAGDTLGLISPKKDTPSSTLHLEVENLMEQYEQKRNSTWIGLNKMFGVEIKGQTNPLDSNISGDIAKVLHQYRVETGTPLPIMKKLGHLR